MTKPAESIWHGTPGYIRETIRNIEDLGLANTDRRKIYADNACRLLRVDV